MSWTEQRIYHDTWLRQPRSPKWCQVCDGLADNCNCCWDCGSMSCKCGTDNEEDE